MSCAPVYKAPDRSDPDTGKENGRQINTADGYKQRKTKDVFVGYRKAGYSKKYLAEHEAELATYRAARAAMNELLGGEKLPKMDALKKQRRELADKKKALYAEYRQAQRDMREAVAVKANIDHLLGLTDGRDDKEQTR